MISAMEHVLTTPTILFGAFDRHNFGDLLFPHVVAALLPGRKLHYAGLVERDLSRYGGHRVRALGELVRELGPQPVNLIHAGGELLSCEAWQAAVMVLAQEQAPAVIARLEHHPQEREAWTQQQLGCNALAPYCVARERLPSAVKIIYNAVGGVELAQRSEALRGEVLANLRSADYVSVRDGVTLAQLQAAGINAQLIPDAAVMVTELFGHEIAQHAAQEEVAVVEKAFPQGYIALQFSADFGDDATLSLLAQQLDELIAATGYGVALFRAGAAPWHDDLNTYQRLKHHLHSDRFHLFHSLHLWDICALLSRSKLYCGTSLHGRIVATAFGLPRLNFSRFIDGREHGKQHAYIAAWELSESPGVVAMAQLAREALRAIAIAPQSLQRHAEHLAAHYRQQSAVMLGLLG